MLGLVDFGLVVLDGAFELGVPLLAGVLPEENTVSPLIFTLSNKETPTIAVKAKFLPYPVYPETDPTRLLLEYIEISPVLVTTTFKLYVLYISVVNGRNSLFCSGIIVFTFRNGYPTTWILEPICD